MCLSVFPVGLDYQSCPTSEDCENNPVDSYWKSASIQVILGWLAGRLSRCGICEQGTGGFRGWAIGSLLNFSESQFLPLRHSDSRSLFHKGVRI